jgi:hypothetical protein
MPCASGKASVKTSMYTGCASGKASVKITMLPAPKLYSAKPNVVKCIFDSSAQSSEKIYICSKVLIYV